QKLSSALTNPNFEQFGGRAIPFFGDYLMVSAVDNSVAAVWTDARDVIAGPDSDGNDVAGDSHNGGACTSSFSPSFDGTAGRDQRDRGRPVAGRGRGHQPAADRSDAQRDGRSGAGRQRGIRNDAVSQDRNRDLHNRDPDHAERQHRLLGAGVGGTAQRDSDRR